MFDWWWSSAAISLEHGRPLDWHLVLTMLHLWWPSCRYHVGIWLRSCPKLIDLYLHYNICQYWHLIVIATLIEFYHSTVTYSLKDYSLDQVEESIVIISYWLLIRVGNNLINFNRLINSNYQYKWGTATKWVDHNHSQVCINGLNQEMH